MIKCGQHNRVSCNRIITKIAAHFRDYSVLRQNIEFHQKLNSCVYHSKVVLIINRGSIYRLIRRKRKDLKFQKAL